MTSALEQETKDLIASAQIAKAAMDAAEKALRTQLEIVINALIPLGTKFNRQTRGRPPHLYSVKTVRGNDRNTHFCSGWTANS